MNRLNDHLCFAVRFVGAGYVALWPVSTPADGDLFGASQICGGGGALDLVCGMPHPLQFGIGLHVAGAACTAAAAAHLVLRGLLRARRRRQAAAAGPAEARPPAAIAPPAPKPRSRRPMPPPRKLVEPRTHFGLRGLPQ